MRHTHRDTSAALTESDARLLRRFEYLLAVLVVLLVAAGGRDAAWPFVVWPMYARCDPPPPSHVSETELRLLSRNGAVVRVLPSQLFTPVEISLARRIAAQAFVDDPSAPEYRAVLLRRLKPFLEERDVVEIEAWRLSWATQPTAVPPFDRALPDAETLLGRIHLSDDPPPARRGQRTIVIEGG